METNVTVIILSLFLNVACYLGIPSLFYHLLKKPTTSAKIIAIIITNAICAWSLLNFIGSTTNGAAPFLWSGIAYAIFENKRKKEEKEIEQQGE